MATRTIISAETAGLSWRSWLLPRPDGTKIETFTHVWKHPQRGWKCRCDCFLGGCVLGRGCGGAGAACPRTACCVMTLNYLLRRSLQSSVHDRGRSFAFQMPAKREPSRQTLLTSGQDYKWATFVSGNKKQNWDKGARTHTHTHQACGGVERTSIAKETFQCHAAVLSDDKYRWGKEEILFLTLAINNITAGAVKWPCWVHQFELDTTYLL